MGAASVVVTGAAIYLLSLATQMSIYASNVASMIGIALAVDYSLFILVRYRQELARGRDHPDALRAALATAGVVVAFSGLTVIVSVAALWTVHSTALRSMATGAIVVIAVSVLAALTLLPALIGLLRRRVADSARPSGRLAGALARLRARTPPRAGPDRWTGWAARVTRQPWRHALLAGGALALLASPVLAMRTDHQILPQLPADDPTRAGFERAAGAARVAAATRTEVVVRFAHADAGSAGSRRTIRLLRRSLAADPEVRRVAPSLRSRDGRAVLLRIDPAHASESAAAKAMVRRLREGLPSVAGRGADIAVGGPATAVEIDAQEHMSGSMWKLVAFVLALSYVVLVALLRSLLLPLKAVLMNLLSIGAAFGVLVMVFQSGWLDGFAGFRAQGHVQVLTPPIVLAIVFGISMDYEILLLSRIRERRAHGASNSRAVAEGLASSARTITGAALVMVAVFAVFVGTGVPAVKELGVGCAVAVAVDATLVRLVLAPAAMALMGEWNWWLPRPLHRLLSRAPFERVAARVATGDARGTS